MIRFNKIQRTIVLCCCISFVACGGKPKNKVPENIYAHDELYTDEFVLKDSLGMDFSGEPYPMGVDESFDDFVFAYASNKDFQVQRTKFPLPIIEDGKESSFIQKKEWVNDSLFTDRYFYTILFDKEEDMDMVGESELTEARVEWIYLDDYSTKSYNFKRLDKIWLLKSISKDQLEDKKNEDFIKFYNQFASDTIFQVSRLEKPLEYVTTDPEDDFEILETVIDANSWRSLSPVLPVKKLVNINYGQPNDAESTSKILAVKGIGNGFSNVYFFKMNKQGSWKLYKFEDIGV